MSKTEEEHCDSKGPLIDLHLASFIRLEIINESPDELRPTLFVSPGSPVEVIECLLQTAGAECVIVKGKNAQVTITGSAIDKSAKAFQVATEGR